VPARVKMIHNPALMQAGANGQRAASEPGGGARPTADVAD